MFKIENEFDLHRKVVDYIRRFYPDLLFIAGLGELQDTSDKRIKSWQKGYQKGQPDLIITSHHKRYNGFCLEFKTPTGRGTLSDAQGQQLKKYAHNGFKTLVSNDYDVITREITAYCEGLRLPCQYCPKKFKTPGSLRSHTQGFHNIARSIMISVKEFNNAIKEVDISEWRHLSVGEIYRIVDYVIMESPYGESMKLTVEDQEGSLFTVWAPEEVRATLCPLGERKEYTHIRSNGLKTRKYWSFDAVQVDPKKDMYV